MSQLFLTSMRTAACEAEIPREQFPRIASSYHPRDILARMSLTCHEEIGRMSDVSDEDAATMQ